MLWQCLRDGAKALSLLGSLDGNVEFTPHLHLWKVGLVFKTYGNYKRYVWRLGIDEWEHNFRKQSITVIMKLFLKYRCQSLGYCLLDKSVCNRRTPRFLTPPSDLGISTRLTGCGLYFLVRSCSLMFSPFSEKCFCSSVYSIPSTPAAPLFLTTCRYAELRFSLLNMQWCYKSIKKITSQHKPVI